MQLVQCSRVRRRRALFGFQVKNDMRNKLIANKFSYINKINDVISAAYETM